MNKKRIKKDRTMNKTNDLLIQRGKLLQEFAENIPTLTDRMRLLLKENDCGWIDAYIYVNDEEKLCINMSDVYNPFEDIKTWLEEIVKHRFACTGSGVNMDCEGYHIVMYYEPLFYTTDQQMFGGADLTGLFYVYDSYDKKIVCKAYVKMKDLVELFYKTILSYAETMVKQDESFVDDWILPMAGKHKEEEEEKAIQETYNRLFVSELIEKFLDNERGDKRFEKIK